MQTDSVVSNKPTDLFAALVKLPQADVVAWLEQHQTQLEPLIQYGKTYAEEVGYQGNLEKALFSLERVDLAAAATKAPLLSALVWRGRANVLQFHERYQESLAASSRAADLYANHGTPFDVAVARTVEVSVLGALERFTEAVELAQWIRPHFQSKSFLFGEARLSGALAKVYAMSWQLPEALAEYEHARGLYQQLERVLDAAWVRHNMGVLANRMDNLALAQQCFAEAYLVFVAHKDLVMLGKTRYNQAQICTRQGQFETALAYLTEARDTLAQLPDSPDMGYVDLFEAQTRRALQQVDLAESLLRRALALFVRLERHLAASEMLIELGHLLAEVDTPQSLGQALSCLEQAERYLQQQQMPLLLAWLYGEQGALLLRLGRPHEAAGKSVEALPAFAQANLPLRQAQIQVLLAECRQLTHPQQAAELYQAALAHSSEWLPELSLRCWYGLGQLARAERRFDDAILAFEKAVAIRDTVRRSLRGHGHQAGYLEGKQDLMSALLAALQVKPEQSERLLIWVEQSKADVMAELLRDQPVDITLSPSLAALLQTRERMRQERDRYAALLHGGQSQYLIESRQQGPAWLAHDAFQLSGVRTLQRQLQRIEEQIAREHHQAIAWRQGQIVSISQIREMLDDTSVLVYYYETERQLWALGVDGRSGAVTNQPLHVSLAEIEEKWQRARRLIAQPGMPPMTARMRLAYFWQQLIVPLAHILEDKKRLIIAPHRGLFHIPFAALYNEEKKHYLAERWLTQLTPGATVLHTCRHYPHPSASILLVGYPGAPDVDEYLPAVNAELQQITQVFPKASWLYGAEATRENVLAQMAEKVIVHLAGHAYYLPAQPLESGMPLADGRWLRASDLYLHHGHLKGATVVLSGCDTGRGRPTGYDILGLNSAFLYAGARGVVSGLWRVDDTATAIFMSEFYRAIAAGKETAQALQQAQLYLLHQTEYTAPYYWASFTLTGDTHSLANLF